MISNIDLLQLSTRYPSNIFQRYLCISWDILGYPNDISIRYPCYIPWYLFKYPNQLSEGYPEISQDILPFSPSWSCRPAKAAGMGQTMCARPDNTAGSRPAHVWPYEWCSAAKNSPQRPRLGIQAVIRVVNLKRTAKPLAHGSFPAADAGRPHSDDPAITPVGAERPKVVP